MRENEPRASDPNEGEPDTTPWALLSLSTHPTLSDGEVHLWLGDVEESRAGLTQAEGVLSEDELDRASRYRFPQDRLRFTFARAMLRRVLSLYLGVRPPALCFRYGNRGKPALIDGDGLEFSLSHSSSLVLLGVTRGRQIGADLELIAEWLEVEAERVARTAISARAANAIRQLPSQARGDALCRLWVAREALAKASGEGLGSASPSVEGLLDTAGSSAPLSFGRWSLLELTPAPGYRGAVAVAGNFSRLRRLRWAMTYENS